MSSALPLAPERFQERFQERLLCFARTLWEMLRQQHPSFPLHGDLHLLPSDIGARNLLFAADQVILKMRVDPYASIEREALSLTSLPEGIGPTCLTIVTPGDFLAHALEARCMRELQDLDLPLGSGVLLEKISGTPMQPPVSDTTMQQVAQHLLRLHLSPADDLPALTVPNRPSSMLRVIEDDLVAIKQRNLFTTDGIKVLRRALRQASMYVEEWERYSFPKIRTLCHGDLRWHNMFQQQERVCLLDFEHAGCGDPAVDLAMMVCRTPLSKFDELRLLHAYSADCGDASFLQRYFLLRPVVGLLCVFGAILHQADIAAGWIPLAVDGILHTQERHQALVAELDDALERLGIPATSRKLVQIHFFQNAQPTPFCGIVAVDGTAASLKSPLSRRLAQALSVPYFDTGAAYRYTALWAWCHQLEPHHAADIAQVQQHLEQADLQLLSDGSVQADGLRWDASLRLARIDRLVGDWAVLPQIRNVLRPVLQKAVLVDAAVVEGRDVGTVLAPHAAKKLFIDAPRSVRTQLLAERLRIPESDARRLLRQRDQQDKSRSMDPLRMAQDAISIRLHPQHFEQQLIRIVRMCQMGTT